MFKGILGAPSSEFSDEFVQGMANRMAFSYGKYGAVADAYPDKVQALVRWHKLSLKDKALLKLALGLLGSFGKRLFLYFDTGNLEYLMDAANFLMIEYMRPAHRKPFFKATNEKAPPGRVWNNGEEDAAANTQQKQLEHAR